MFVGETKRLRIRHFVNADAEFIVRLLNEPSFISNISDKGVRTIEDAIVYLNAGPIASYEEYGFGLNMVELKDSQEPIGMCGLLKRDLLNDPDIGYAFLPECWSQGYARESVTEVLHFPRQTFALEQVLAVVNVENENSIRLLEKSNFKYREMIELYPGEVKVKLFVFDC